RGSHGFIRSPAILWSAYFCEFSTHGFGADAEALGGFLRVGVGEDCVARLVHGFAHRARDRETAAVLGEVVGRAEVVEIKVEKACRAPDQLLKRRAAGRLDKAV